MDFLDKFEKDVTKELVKHLCSKKIFCKYTGSILDYRTAILIEIYQKGEENPKELTVVSPKMADKLTQIKEAIEKKGYTVKFFTFNKEVNLPE